MLTIEPTWFRGGKALRIFTASFQLLFNFKPSQMSGSVNFHILSSFVVRKLDTLETVIHVEVVIFDYVLPKLFGSISARSFGSGVDLVHDFN